MDIGSHLKIGAALIISLGSIKGSASLQDNPDKQVIDFFWYQTRDGQRAFCLILNPGAFLRMTENSPLPWREAIQSDYAHLQLADWIDEVMSRDTHACPYRLSEVTAYSLADGSFAFRGTCQHDTKEIRL